MLSCVIKRSICACLFGLVFLCATANSAIGDEFQAQLVKVENGKVSFRRAEKGLPAARKDTLPADHIELLDFLAGTRGAASPLEYDPDAPPVALPVMKAVIVRARWLNPATNKVEVRELPDGLMNENLRVISHYGLPATIVTDESGKVIQQLLVTLRPVVKGPPLDLERHSGAIETDQRPLPAGALARLGARRFAHFEGIKAWAFSANGRLLAAGGFSLELMDAETGKTVVEVPFDATEHFGSYRSLAFSSDSKLLACGGSRGFVRLVDCSNGKTLDEWHLPGEAVHSENSNSLLSFLPGDDKLIVEDAGDSNVHILDIKTGKLLRTLHNKSGPLNTAAVTKNGETLATQGPDLTICL
jgi:hypothetical protein